MKRLWNLGSLATRKRPPVGTTPADVLHHENKWRLLRFRPRPEGTTGAPLLLVPSLINRWYVLDLLPGKSFAEWMVGQGHDVYVIDWGTPGEEDRHLGFDEIVDGYVGRAISATQRASGAQKVHLLGYCMGGTMAAIHAAAHPDRLASLVAVAAPIKFADDGLLSRWSRSPGFDVRTLVDAFGNVPWQLMQSAFQMLRPTLGLSKAVHLLDRAWDDEFLDGFLALETWGNDNVSFPGEAYARWIDELYRRDALVNGTFTLSGRPAKLSQITAPTIAIGFQHDNIVSAESAKALVEKIGRPDAEWLLLPGGHVGAMTSRAASKRVWPKISEWLRKHDAAPVKRGKRG